MEVGALRILSKIDKFLSGKFDLSGRKAGVKREDLVPIIDALIDKINKGWVLLLLTSLGIVVVAAIQSDEAFLLQKGLSLPFMDMEVPVSWFFGTAPLLALGLYSWLLFQEYDLLQKLTLFPGERPGEGVSVLSATLSRYFPREIGFPAAYVVQGLFWGFLVLGPLVTLLFLQLSSLRFRVALVTRIISVCIAVDLIFVVLFIFLSWLVRRGNHEFWWNGSRWRSRVFVGLGVAFAAWAFVFWFSSYSRLMTDPAFCVGPEERFLRFFPVQRYVDLADVSEPRILEGIELGDRDLRCANFSGAWLREADFTGAILWGAKLDRADLQGADLSAVSASTVPEGGSEEVHSRRASFAGANLLRAKLARADLRGANLSEAILQEADLSRANLSGGNAFNANLVASNLSGAHLRAIDFRKAQLEYATFDDSDLELARFDEAGLDGSSFAGAKAFGASFKNARLRGARGLELSGVNLQYARLWGMNSCGYSYSFPQLVDLRHAKLDPADWMALAMEISSKTRSPLSSEVLLRIRNQGMVTPACISDLSPAELEPKKDQWAEFMRNQWILYENAQLMVPGEDWPAGASLVEDDHYYAALARFLLRRACSENTAATRPDWNLRVLLERRAQEVDRFGEILRRDLRSTSCAALQAPKVPNSQRVADPG